jgi:hypothetical protein
MLEIRLNGANAGGKFAKVSSQDYESVKRHSWYYREGYALTKVRGKEIRMHRFVMNVTDPNLIVDHKDRDRLNNTRENLRVVSLLENANNRVDNVFIECFGESKTISEWSRDERCVVGYDVLRGRLRRGVPAWAAILAPKEC